jgi:hypothetical protein
LIALPDELPTLRTASIKFLVGPLITFLASADEFETVTAICDYATDQRRFKLMPSVMILISSLRHEETRKTGPGLVTDLGTGQSIFE